MAVPTVGGNYSVHNASSLTVGLDISSVPVDGWMVVSAMLSSSSAVITPPAGWTTLHVHETTGTRGNYLFGKIKTSGDGSTATFSQDTVAAMSYGLLWGTGAGAVDGWILGTSKVRSTSGEPSGARYTNTAPSITTTGSQYLALTISNEATNAYTAGTEIASVTAGWTQQLYLAQVALNDRIETIYMGTKDMESAGATGDATIIYTNPQDSNGWAMQIALPYEVVAPLQTPQVVGTPTTSLQSAASSSITITRPSGILNDDLMVVVIRGQVSDMSVEPSSAGFTRRGPAFVAATSTYRANGIYTRPITDATNEPSSYTFTFTSGTGRMVATAFIVRGADITDPIAGYFNSYGGTTITGGRQVDSYAINSVPSLALFYAGSEFASPYDHVPATTPSGYTQFASVTTNASTSVSRTYVWLGSQVIESGGTVATGSITWSGTASGAAAEGVAFRGSSSAPPDPAGEGITVQNGAGADVQVFYTTADGPRTPSSIIPVRRGFDTALDAINTHGSTWAHRGGSNSYPEMSLYGYTQSVVRGYGVLEVSLARTSDGVWFGLHDQTTDRTSGGTYGNASAQTWAQIQAQQITVGPTGAPQPYMRWEEIVAAYGSTHVLVVDPKYALGSYRTEFLNMVYNDIGPDRAIIKYSGPGSTPTLMAQEAAAMGMQTWGFFYASDASAAQGGNGNLQTYGPSWTTIGMDYTASQAVWNEALALGKPVIAHIVPNQAGYDTAMAKGAVGVQVSGVAAVAPISWWNT